LIPYSHDIDGDQLEEIIAWQKEKTIRELESMPDLPKRKHSVEEVGQALNDYTKFRRRKEEDINPRYY